jgi:dipeptidyl aminopeptidase/acylaminoacyl peptidase
MSARRTLLFLLSAALVFSQVKRPLKLDDLARFREVRDPQCSPDGQFVAYTVSTIDAKEDKSATHVWMIGYDGANDRQVTSSTESESSPRWSPDGKYLSFTSSRTGKAKGNQLWLLPRAGGEAMQLTEIKGRLQGYEWSPDASKIAMVVGDPDPDADAGDAPAKPKTPKPIVIDRYKYKQDVQGYLLSGRHSYVYIFDMATKKLDRLTTQKTADEAGPVWSPDSKRIAFTSNHDADPDRNPDTQIWVADAKPGSAEVALTKPDTRAGRGRVEWSPDGKLIAFLVSDEKTYNAYGMERLAVVASNGSSAPALVASAKALDRGVSSPHWSADGKSIMVLVTDDRNVYPARVPISGGSAERLMASPVVISSPTMAAGCAAVISGSDTAHGEIYTATGGGLKQLTHQNDALFAELDIPATEEVNFKSKDGTDVHGLLTYPVGYVKGTRVPLLLRIHGGPNGQDAHQFSVERQVFAANGYAVLAVNYRGSAGRGQKYSYSIWADWGHYEVEDLLAGVDHVIKMGVADPGKLGVGGWSYGGILTDYIIASDKRFKAATSGAGTAFTVSFYGTDQYILQYDYEIGPPWTAKGWDTYVKISYPFLHADRIKTPTLFLGGERDFNVPVQGGQQMYQALRSLGVETQLVIYPNEFHGISRPSYVKDRYERYLNWYAKYVLGKPAPAATSTSASDQK